MIYDENKVTCSHFYKLYKFFSPHIAQAAEKQESEIDKGFDIDLTGFEFHSFGTFNQLGFEITPLAQLYFRIIQEEQEWIGQPRLYIKDDKGYVHLWKRDGTNVLYIVTKESSELWEVVDVKRKKIDRIPVQKNLLKEVLIERWLQPISTAVKKHYGEPKLWYRGFEKVIKIEEDEQDYVFYITVQVQTFEGAHNPPYGEETITFKIRGSQIEMIDFKHRDISKEESIKLELR
ncbi:DUF3888 domain-containing protein [Virgibacillus sp. DJP39]|uniref:DUF3888 domain-containing protein n=1 Tax=Virgibacillus sp. DJP39 TaxID=3409790 RepID=UPI003BB6B54A